MTFAHAHEQPRRASHGPPDRVSRAPQGACAAAADPADAALDALLAAVAGSECVADVEPDGSDSAPVAGTPVSDAEFAELLDAFSGAAAASPGGGAMDELLDALGDVQARLLARVEEDPELASIAAELDQLTARLRAVAPAGSQATCAEP